MADELTKIIDVITPEVFNSYMNMFTAEKSAFIQSGVAVADERVSKNITAGGLLVNMPFWTDLTGDDEVLGDGDKALATGKITAKNDVAAVLYRGKGWKVNELAAQVSGDDPLKALMTKIGGYWLRREQRILINVLNGAFSKALKDTHLNDQSTEEIDSNLILNTKQLLGDNADQLAQLIMHSAIYTSLQKLDLIDFVEPSQGGKKIPFYQGYVVTVDDSVPAEGTGNEAVYTTYLMANGSIGRNEGNPAALTTFETDREAAKGNDVIYTRRAFTMHPYGVKWTDAERETGNITPTNTDLQNGDNYEKVYEDKQIGIVALKCKALPVKKA